MKFIDYKTNNGAPMPLLDVTQLHRRFGGLHAVKDVSFAVQAGTITGVIGPNGAGKTTLFNLISGTLKPDAGTVRFDGQPIQHLAPHQIAACGIFRTFQNIKLFAKMTVLENVMLGRHTRSAGSMVAGMLNLPQTWREEKQSREHARAMLDLLGIAHLADVDAQSLAFGQQRDVELARALAGEPTLLLLDEPAAGLNIHETEHLGELIRKINGRGVTILMVEHDMSLVMAVCDHLVVLSFGQVIAQGPPRDIQQNQEVIRVYLGDDQA